MAYPNEEVDASMDKNDLYREEVFTDRRVGSIRRLMPVDANGNPDTQRATTYVGQAQVMTPAGALPLNFEIPATTLEQALQGFAQAANQAMEETMQELKSMQRDAASSIVMPGQGGGSGMPGGGGGLPGGGQFHLG